MMDIRRSNVFLRMETTCGSLLCELQEIWDEVGESESGRDDMLMEIEQQCLEIYTKKVDQAYRSRAKLRQAIADAEAELAQICSVLGERPTYIKEPDKKGQTLKEELDMIIPFLEEMRKRRIERKKQFVDVLAQICDISDEIQRSSIDCGYNRDVDEKDLSLKRLEELHTQLHALQKEKSNRLKQLLDNLNTLNSLCMVLDLDFKEKIEEVHPTLDDCKGTKNISDDTISRLSITIQNLREIKIERLKRVQDFASSMLELWNLMDTPSDEQHMFHNVTSMLAASEHEITEPSCLSVSFISHVEAEVLRLERLKSSKMKELILKKRSELEEICRQTHMVLGQSVKQFSVEAIDSGAVEPSYMLEQIELQISEVKEEAFSRKEILERVEKWKAACEEECWLEEYNRDESRYNGGRGGHLSLKRAEKARVLVNKIPAMVETLSSKTRAWEKERGKEFFYDGIQLLAMLEDYSILRQEKEKEQQRQRDQRKRQGRLLTEQEALFGSKPSPTKSSKKAPRYSLGGAATNNRRFSLGGLMLQKQNAKPGRTALHSHPINKITLAHQDTVHNHHQNGGKRINATTGQIQKKQAKPKNPGEFGSPKNRKPLSPLSSTVETTINPQNTPEKQEVTTPRGLSASRTPRSTLNTKAVKSSEERETSFTPKKPTTPMEVTTPSTTLSTRSATPYTPTLARKVGQVNVNVNGGDVEYSFEEIRAGVIFQERTLYHALKF